MKAYFTEMIRTVRRTVSRFLSIMLIVALGAGVFAGVKTTSDDMLITADKYYRDNDFADITLISPSGFTESDIGKVRGIESVGEAYGVLTAEALLSLEGNTAAARFISINDGINRLTLTKGRFPESENECVVVSSNDYSSLMEIGETITFEGEHNGLNDSYEIVGTVDSPEYISFDRGSSTVGSGKLNYVIYIREEGFRLPAVPAGNMIYPQIAVKAAGAEREDTFGDAYRELIDSAKDDISDVLGDGIYILDRDSNVGFVSFEGDADKIDAISKIFPVFFFLVAALVCLTTMTRMVEDERIQIGTVKALGYGKGAIVLKYVLYSFTATLAGCALGLVIGYNLFPRAIFAAYSILYTLPSIETPFHWGVGALTALAAVLCTEIFTVAACISSVSEVPASLMLPKAPKMGKRVLLERVGFLWNRLSFIHKVTVRNIFRYKKRLLMTVVGIAGCTALMLTGFGLKDSISDIINKQFGTVTLYDFNASVVSGLDYDSSGADGVLSESNVRVMPYHEKYIDAYAAGGDDMIHAYVLCPDSSEGEKDAERADFISLHSRTGSENDRVYYSLTDDAVVITEKLASKLGLKAGDSISFTVNSGERKDFKISAVAENYVYNYIYILPSLYEDTFGEALVFDKFACILPDDVTPGSREAEDIASSLLSLGSVTSVSFKHDTEKTFSDAIGSLNIVVVVLIVCAAALAAIVIYNLANINITERIREIATIKVLGFTDSEVTAYVFRESAVLTLFGIAAGLILGIYLHSFVVTTAEVEIVMFGRDIGALSYVFSALLTFGFSMLVNFLMHWRLKRISMVESLKSAE